MKHNHIYIFCAFIYLLSFGKLANAQVSIDKDYRTKAVYFPQSKQLKSKSMYYFDYWSEKEIWDGTYTEWDEQGNVLVEGNYKEGKKDGQWNYYHPNGLLQSSSQWQNGLQQGIYITYNKKGDKTSEGYFRNGLKDGVFISYYPDDKIKTRIPFRAGKQQGKGQYYAASGKLQKETEFVDGRKKADNSKKDSKSSKDRLSSEEKTTQLKNLFHFKKSKKVKE